MPTNRHGRLNLRILLLLALFLPAHLAIVLLSDLHFIPSARGSAELRDRKERTPGRDRLRIQIVRGSDSRTVFTETRGSAQVRDLSLPEFQPPSGVLPPEPPSCA